MNKREQQWLIFVIFVLMPVFVPNVIMGQEIIEIPKATHFEKGVPVSRLVKVKEIQSDFNEDLFLAMPWEIVVSKKGTIYVYDAKQEKIFFFSNKYFYIGQFLETGEGPGEVLPGTFKKLYAAPDGNLNLSDGGSKRILHFSENGKYVKGVRIPTHRNSMMPSLPVTDKKGNYYIYSMNGGIVDKMDPKMTLLHTFLEQELVDRYVGYKPPWEENAKNSPRPKLWLLPNPNNTMYDFTSDGHFLIYLFRSSTAFLFKDKKLVRKFGIYIDRINDIHMKRSKKTFDAQKKIDPRRGIKHCLMFSSCFVDKDEPYFYLQINDVDKKRTLYKFDLSGKLVGIFKAVNAFIKTKQNGLFYGRGGPDSNPVIFKIKEET